MGDVMAAFSFQNLFSSHCKIYSYNSHISFLWMCLCVFLLISECNVSGESCTISRAENDVLAYALHLDSLCHVTTKDCERQQAALDLRKCACVCPKSSSTYKMDKKMCVTNTETNSGCTIYSGKTSSDLIGILSAVSESDTLKLSNLPSRRCSPRSSNSVFLNNGTWSKVTSAFPFRLRRNIISWRDNPNKFTYIQGRIFKLALYCRRKSYCVIFKVKGNLSFKCVGPVSPPVIHTTIISTATTLATSPLTKDQITITTMPPLSSRSQTSSKLSTHSTMSSRRWSSTLGKMVTTLSSNGKDERTKSNSPSYLVGVIVGVVLAAVCILIFLVFCCRQRLRNKPESAASSFTSNPAYEVGTESMVVSHRAASFRSAGGFTANRGHYMSLRGRNQERDSYQELIKPEGLGSGSENTSTNSIVNDIEIKQHMAEEKSSNPVYNVLEDITVEETPQTRRFADAEKSVSPDYQMYETPESVFFSSTQERPTFLPCKNPYNLNFKDRGAPRTLQSDGYESPTGISQFAEPCTGSFIPVSKSGYEIPEADKITSPVYEEPRQEFSFSGEDSKSTRRRSLERGQSYEVPVDSVRPEYLEIVASPVSENKEANYQQLGASQNCLYEPLRKENEQKL